MSEKNIPRLEHAKSHESPVGHEHHERAQKHLHEQAEKARHEKSAENLAKIHELAKAEAELTKKVVAESVQNESNNTADMQHSLKASAYERILTKTHQKLPKTAQTFSKVVHNPTVDKISEISAKTVARPSGFLGGSICAFLGSLIVYYSASRSGFKYNYLLLFLLFIAGYIIGSILELIVWFFYSRKQRY
jgi:hypothetical protein